MIVRTVGLSLAMLSIAGCARLPRFEPPSIPVPFVSTSTRSDAPRERVEQTSPRVAAVAREAQEPASILVEAAPQLRVTTPDETRAADSRLAPANLAPTPGRAEPSRPRGTQDAEADRVDEAGKRLRRSAGNGYDVL